MGTTVACLAAVAALIPHPASMVNRSHAVNALPRAHGEAVEAGDIVRIRFRACRGDGREVANSLVRGLDYTFVLGEPGRDPVISAIQPGAKVGSRRRIELNVATTVWVTVVSASAPRRP